MDIAILGTGRVGGALGVRWAQKGHRVVYGARDPQAEDVRNLVAKSGPNASATTVTAAAASCHAILLAIPWSVTHDMLSTVGPVAGKTLIDCINPIRSDFSGLDLDVSTAPSAAEQIAGWAPGAKVVKAFNTVSDAALVNPKFGDQKATMFYCGDDKEAKALVRQLTEDADLEPVDAGPLKNASYLEALAMLYIHLAIFGGWGADCAFKLVRR